MAKKKASAGARKQKRETKTKAEKKPAKRVRNMPLNMKFPDMAEMPCMEVRPERLTGSIVELLPLRYADIPDIEKAARQSSVFKHFIDGWLVLRLGVPAYVHKLVEEQEQTGALAFSVVYRKTRKIVGVTRFYAIDKRSHRLSVASWYAKDYHGTGVNTEAKYLLLKHAFDVMHCRRVQFEIDEDNKKSINAIKSIGARYEGKHSMDIALADGRQRNSVVYAITSATWEKARATIERKLKRHYATEGIR